MGASTSYTASIEIRAQFEVRRITDTEPPPRREDFEQVIDNTLFDHPWFSDYQHIWSAQKGLHFIKLAEPKQLNWNRDRYGDQTELNFHLRLHPEGFDRVKETQFFSIIRYAKMLGKIISARYPKLRSLEIQPCFKVLSQIVHRFAEPGDIVERRSQPGKYFYFDRVCDKRWLCELIEVEALPKYPDRVTTRHDLTELKPVDHIPRVSDEERSALLSGAAFGNRESLIAKWRPRESILVE